MKAKSKRLPTLFEALCVIIFLIVMLFICIFKLGGTAYLPLILGICLTSLLGIFKLGVTWKELEESIVNTVSMAMVSIIILMLVSIIIGLWMASGIVPSIIYYGLDIISPGLFLPATMLICGIVSLGTGSSWTTVGTIGVALLGIGTGLGLPAPLVAGCIISGSYFGDKLSPLSDTTNLASAMTNTDLFVHIKHMLYTTIPAFIISSLIYFYLGSKYSLHNNVDLVQVSNLKSNILMDFQLLSPFFILVPIFVIFLVVKKVPAIPSLFIGAALGAIVAIVFQGHTLSDIMNIMQSGYVSSSSLQEVQDLLSRGGLQSMMNTIALTICALSLGATLEKTGVLITIVNSLLKVANSSFKLILTTMFTCFFINFTTGDQYLSIVLPGRMYTDAFRSKNLDSRNLSRALEDSATLTSPIIPWNACGIYMSATLGVSVLAYLPFSFVNILTPLISLTYAFFNVTITKISTENEKDKYEEINDNYESKLSVN